MRRVDWPIIAATSFGFALVQLDVSIVNVALARISQSIGSGVVGLQWIIDSYAIVFASLLLAAGALGDRIGARRTYVAGLPCSLSHLSVAASPLEPGRSQRRGRCKASARRSSFHAPSHC